MLFIHGSAADHTTWSIQLASPLRERFTLIAYDRRRDVTSVEQHAADAADLLAGQRALIVGSSFGSVVALDLVRTRPELCAGAVLIEPPMAASDELAAAPAEFLSEYDRRAAEQGGPAAAEFFLRTVLGDAAFSPGPAPSAPRSFAAAALRAASGETHAGNAPSALPAGFERIPRSVLERAKQKWAEIRADCVALIAYRPRYAELAAVDVPVLLVGGDRSAAYFRPTLEALHCALPRAWLEIVPGAGHMLHVEASRRFTELLVGFADELEIE